MISRLIAVTAGFVLALWMQAAPVSAQQAAARLGFVVGNAEYAHAPLSAALDDAGLVAEALRSVGFEVTEGANLTQVDFVRSFRDFLSKLEAAGPDAVGFVYVSGYGFAFEGDNYLVAVDARLDRRATFRSRRCGCPT
jgi:uncharacterized caspase-like protein